VANPAPEEAAGKVAVSEHPIQGFPRYTVREDGVVLRDGRPRRSVLRNDYLRVQLFNGGKRTNFPLHRLVLEAFVGPRPSPRHHGAHLDGDRYNNIAANLAWKLPEENEADKRLHGTTPQGGIRRPTPAARLRAILKRVSRGQSYTEIAAHFGLHRHSVSRIARGLRRKLGISARAAVVSPHVQDHLALRREELLPECRARG